MPTQKKAPHRADIEKARPETGASDFLSTITLLSKVTKSPPRVSRGNCDATGTPGGFLVLGAYGPDS